MTGASSGASRPASTTTRPSSAIVWPSRGRSKWPAVNRPADPGGGGTIVQINIVEFRALIKGMEDSWAT